MSSNEKIIQTRYANKSEENRATLSRADGLEFYFTKKLLEKYVNKQSSVIEIGCGTGYYGMFLSDKCKEYTGVDLTPENIELFNEKILNKKIKNISTIVGDATDLVNIRNNTFDIVLVLGPMYHLPPDERELVFSEAKRICKDNGIIIFAYINKYGAYLQCGILAFPDIYPNQKANECVLIKGIDDVNPDFYYTIPEEIENSAKNHGLTKLKNVGVNFAFNKEQINNMDEEKFRLWLDFSNYLCNSESCTGLSAHSLLVCKKI
ncbi:MAG: class I SAM-dependent methyltransferase [Methanobacteriaceae archaeon]|jgi:ubiquinone/menaquinone biosynthesis C-methylase UbiE|nr:class I SAM-dependent methyltransferase [Candidatus Methanorudis spinitermitis]